MTPEALEAERIARAFELTYLSAEGYEKLARLVAWVRSGNPLPRGDRYADIVRSWPPRIPRAAD